MTCPTARFRFCPLPLVKFKSSSPRTRRSGLTLIEIMIALTMTLIVLGAMMTAFQYASEQMQMGRATLELSNRLRSAEKKLRSDLANLTVEPRPYTEDVIPNGYFEYVEGPRRDLTFPFGVDGDGDGVPISLDNDDTDASDPAGQDYFDLLNSFRGPEFNYLGDVDDILAFTVRSTAGEVFRGRFYDLATGQTATIESPLAEIVWWTQFSDTPGGTPNVIDITDSVTVFRRVLLINPELTGLPTAVAYNVALNWLAVSDVSARIEANTGGGYDIVVNSLQDLANRRNRFTRFPNHLETDPTIPDGIEPFLFPYPLNRGSLLRTRSSTFDPGGQLLADGNDVMLTDVAAFDVKVFAPRALTYDIAGVGIGPSDPGFRIRNTENSDYHDGVYTGANGQSAGETDVNPNDGINDTAIRGGAYADLGHIDVNVTSTATIAAGLGGVAQFSQLQSPVGLFVPGVAHNFVPRSPLNYQFNFQGTRLNSANTSAVRNNGAGVSMLATEYIGLLDTAFDSWTPGYESDGINQDPNIDYFQNVSQAAMVVNNGDTLVDEGTDGVDNNNANGVDDYSERETLPPYPDPIRGLKVTIRLIEKTTQQIEQTSIEQSFVPQ